jgi:hypothetical protein
MIKKCIFAFVILTMFTTVSYGSWHGEHKTDVKKENAEKKKKRINIKIPKMIKKGFGKLNTESKIGDYIKNRKK